MHQQKGKKILIYLFVFLIVGSINNTSLTSIKPEKINALVKLILKLVPIILLSLVF